jgi:hypothetical protein
MELDEVFQFSKYIHPQEKIIMSYKFSHTGKDFAKKYDANIASNFESRIYEIEKIILFDILKRYFPNVDLKVMDFAS